MSENVDKALDLIAGSSFIVFLGVLTSLFFGFLTRVLFVRSITQDEYGLFSLSLTLVTIFTTISTLGVGEGSTRFISYFRGREDDKSIKDAIISSLMVTLTVSILITFALMYLSKNISIMLFHTENLTCILKLMSCTIPFMVLINVFVAIFRGFNNTRTKIYFNDFLRPLFYLLLVILVILLNLSFIEMIYAYISSILMTCFIFIIYFRKKAPITIDKFDFRINYDMIRMIVVFSIPLLVINILLTMMSWTDTLMIGYFMFPEDVSLYNAAYPIATLISIIINSIGFLYVPITSQYYGRKQIGDLGTIYSSSTKWSFMLTVPIFFVIFMFPEMILNLLFGPLYVKASTTLQILSIGFIFNSFFGLNYYTLISSGKSEFIMHCSLISAAINIILNIFLIPRMGIVGAATASAISFVAIEILMTLKLNKYMKIHPFSPSYLRLIAVTFILLCVFYVFKEEFVSSIAINLISTIIFIILYFFSIYLLNILDETDIALLTRVKSKL